MERFEAAKTEKTIQTTTFNTEIIEETEPNFTYLPNQSDVSGDESMTEAPASENVKTHQTDSPEDQPAASKGMPLNKAKASGVTHVERPESSGEAIPSSGPTKRSEKKDNEQKNGKKVKTGSSKDGGCGFEDGTCDWLNRKTGKDGSWEVGQNKRIPQQAGE